MTFLSFCCYGNGLHLNSFCKIWNRDNIQSYLIFDDDHDDVDCDDNDDGAENGKVINCIEKTRREKKTIEKQTDFDCILVFILQRKKKRKKAQFINYSFFIKEMYKNTKMILLFSERKTVKEIFKMTREKQDWILFCLHNN